MILMGLPEGIEAVAIRAPHLHEPILVSDGRIAPAGRTDQKQLVLRILPGYEMVYRMESNTWEVQRMAVPRPRVLRATFLAGDDRGVRAVHSYLAHAPGMVDITEEEVSDGSDA